MSKLTAKVMSRLVTVRQDEETGATMVEYGLMVAAIAAVVGLAAFALGGEIKTLFDGLLPITPTTP